MAEGSPSELKRQVLGDSVLFDLGDAGRDSERARTVLATKPFVTEIAETDAGLRCYVSDGAVVLPELLRLLDSERIALRSVSLSEPTLDDVFLAKTGRSLRDAAT